MKIHKFALFFFFFFFILLLIVVAVKVMCALYCPTRDRAVVSEHAHTFNVAT